MGSENQRGELVGKDCSGKREGGSRTVPGLEARVSSCFRVKIPRLLGR